MGSFRDTLCAVVDTVLDTISDINTGMYSVFCCFFLRNLSEIKIIKKIR